jgi:hypothetical protein
MERVGEGTWFAIDRKIFSSDLWFSSPWKLKIFIYLLGHANHESNSFMGIELNRGELIRSYRTIAKDCGYKIGYRLKQPSLDTVRRICEELTKELRIQQRTVHQGTVFTIINYNELQPVSKQRTERRTVKQSYSDRTATVQDNNKEELIKNKRKDIVFSPDFELFWKTYPKRTGKTKALEAWNKYNGSRPPIEIIIHKIEELKKTDQWAKDNGQFIPHPTTWLNRGGWDDETKIDIKTSKAPTWSDYDREKASP